MAHPIAIRREAKKLRTRGYSLNEISKKLHLSKGTLSPWLSNIELSSAAQKRLQEKQILGQYKAVLIKKQLAQRQKEHLLQEALKMFKDLSPSKQMLRLYCSLLWWCEGNKDNTQVKFTNSDSTLICNFLYTLRNGFEIDESKFRALIHLHEYHNENDQKRFWNNVTGIPINQFHNSYLKPHTGIRKRDNYQGTIAISYYDAKIAKQLVAIYNAFTLTYGGVR